MTNCLLIIVLHEHQARNSCVLTQLSCVSAFFSVIVSFVASNMEHFCILRKKAALFFFKVCLKCFNSLLYLGKLFKEIKK